MEYAHWGKAIPYKKRKRQGPAAKILAWMEEDFGGVCRLDMLKAFSRDMLTKYHRG